jgi:hypothetical protein
MELCVVGGPTKGHHSLGADRAVGSCGPAKGHDGAAARAEPPSVSSIPAMELRVIGGLARGHRSLGVDRVGGSCRLAKGARWGNGWPQGTVGYGLRRALARSAASRGTPQLWRCGVQSRWSTILRRCGGEPFGEWRSRIRLEANGQGDTPFGLVPRLANSTPGLSDVMTKASVTSMVLLCV